MPVHRARRPLPCGRTRSGARSHGSWAWLGKSGWKDWQIIELVVRESWTLVTNNAGDFRRLHGTLDLHPGLIIIVPQLHIDRQEQALGHVLSAVAGRDLTNTVIELSIEGDDFVIAAYDLPSA